MKQRKRLPLILALLLVCLGIYLSVLVVGFQNNQRAALEYVRTESRLIELTVAATLSQ